MVNDENADIVEVSKGFQLANNLIVTGIAVALSSHLPHLLQGINHNHLSFGIPFEEILHLLFQSLAQPLGRHRQHQIPVAVYPKHPGHALLEPPVLILQGQVKYRSPMYLVTPDSLSRTDGVGYLEHQKGFADLGCSGKEVHSFV